MMIKTAMMTTKKINPRIMPIKKIDPEKFYTPKEVISFGIMTAGSQDTQRQMLLRFIRQKRIEAKNLGGTRKPRYVVQGKHLIAYRDTQMKPGEYEKKSA